MISFAVADVVQVRLVAILQQQISINVLTYVCTAVAGTSETYVNGAVRCDTLFNAAYKALMCNLAAWRGVGVRRITPTQLSIEYTSIGNAGAGTAGANPQPKQLAGLLRKNTDRPKEKGRGRLYVAFPATADNSSTANPIAGYITRLNTLGTALSTNVLVGTAPNTATLKPVLWDRTLLQATDIASMTGQAYWATQRRRGDYGKANVVPF
jgi:hypothetical protein